jgi:hypothetical protein
MKMSAEMTSSVTAIVARRLIAKVSTLSRLP